MDARAELKKTWRGIGRVAGLARWWWLIRARYYSVGIAILAFGIILVGGVIPVHILSKLVAEIGGVVFLLAILVFMVSFLAPLGVYLELKNLPKDAEWYPSRWYYLTIAPGGLLGLILAYVYGRRRLRTHGNASYAEFE